MAHNARKCATVLFLTFMVYIVRSNGQTSAYHENNYNSNSSIIPNQFNDSNTDVEKDSSSSSNITTNSTLDSCPPEELFELAPEYYTWSDHETLKLKAISTILTKDEYRDTNGTIEVCGDPWQILSPDLYNIISKIGLWISEVALFLKIMTYILFKTTRNFPSRITLCISIALFMSLLLQLLGLRKRYHHNLCVAVAIAMHYFFLTYFCWLTVLGFDLLRIARATTVLQSRVGAGRAAHRLFLRYSVYGWGLPALVILTTVLFEFAAPPTIVKPEYGAVFCWLNSGLANLVFFVTPFGMAVCANLIMLGITTFHICYSTLTSRKVLNRQQTLANANNPNARKPTTRSTSDPLRLYLLLRLALVTGITWSIMFLYMLFQRPWIEVTWLVLNVLQGVYILVAFPPSKKDLSKLFQNFRCCNMKGRETRNVDSTGRGESYKMDNGVDQEDRRTSTTSMETTNAEDESNLQSVQTTVRGIDPERGENGGTIRTVQHPHPTVPSETNNVEKVDA